MNSNKKSTGARGAPQPFNWQPSQAPRFKPVVAQLKSVVSAQRLKHPIAPPVYRPQSIPKVLQTKRSSGKSPHEDRAPRQPIAPPVYRPEAKKIVQPKTILPQRKSPTPPPVNLWEPHSSIQRMLKTSMHPDVVVARDPYKLIDARLDVTADRNTIGIANFGAEGRTPITVHVHYHSIPLGFQSVEIHVTGANLRATDEVNTGGERYQGAPVYAGQ